RPDGYHLLDSLVVFADVGYRLTAVPAPELTLAIDGPFANGLGDGSDNLVMRAALALRAALGGDTPGAALSLTKNLPVAAGLGGGSADVAAVGPAAAGRPARGVGAVARRRPAGLPRRRPAPGRWHRRGRDAAAGPAA